MVLDQIMNPATLDSVIQARGDAVYAFDAALVEAINQAKAASVPQGMIAQLLVTHSTLQRLQLR